MRITPTWILASWLALAAPPPITVRACCATVAEVADVAVRIHVATDPTNVAVRLVLEGPVSQRSEFPVTEHTPATFWPRPYQRLPAGDYEIVAILFRHDGRTYEAGRAVDRVHIGPLTDTP